MKKLNELLGEYWYIIQVVLSIGLWWMSMFR